MVAPDPCLYLLTGQDTLSKDAIIQRLKEEFLNKDTRDFNSDVFYGRDLELSGLQERLLALPVGAKKRMVVVREAQNLKDDARKFLLKYIKKPHRQVILVLDSRDSSAADKFLREFSRYARVLRFKEAARIDTFSLSRCIDSRRTAQALGVLSQLLKNGEKPEFILGGLRYAWENTLHGPVEKKKKLAYLLRCDIEIKTGRLRPDFALERLVVSLCGFAKPAG